MFSNSDSLKALMDIAYKICRLINLSSILQKQPTSISPIATHYNNLTKIIITSPKQEQPTQMPLPHKNNQQSQIQQGEQVSQHQQSSEWIKVKYAGRKNLCEICDNIMAKYTCPKCMIKTCSLPCTTKHKLLKQCSGERQSIEYVSRDDIDEKIVAKDYNFIEKMIGGADKVKKVLSGVKATITLEPRRFKILRSNARQLYNIRLSNGPNILERHRDNISFFFVKNKSIYWVFELLYFQGKDETQMRTSKTITQPISDQQTFMQVLPEDYLDRQLLEMRGVNTTKREEFKVFFENKEKLNEWASENEQEQKPSSKKIVFNQRIVSGKFTTLYELIEYNTRQSVCEQMRDISVFEFPTLFVVHNSLIDEFLDCYKQAQAVRGDKKSNERGAQRERSREKSLSRKAKPQQEE